MDKVTLEQAAALARIEHGTVDPTRLTLFSTMKDEMGFLPAWLAHHRGLGFEQFLIWDDRSGDGSFEYLCAQPDVVVMRADLPFGAELAYVDPDGRESVERMGTLMKIALPHRFFDGAYVAYVDGDEFLVLPPGVTSMVEVVERLRAEGAPSAVATVVEFFPRDVAGLAGALPQSFDDLVAAYPYFQAEPLVELVPGAQPTLKGRSKTARLFERYAITPKVIRKGWHRIWMPKKAKKAQKFQKSPRHKTPLVLRDATSRLTGSHYANLPPSSEVLLCVAHFVFTAQFADKIRRATEWGGHANGAVKYRYYAELLEKMGGVEDGFLDAQSTRYEGPESLARAGLLRW